MRRHNPLIMAMGDPEGGAPRQVAKARTGEVRPAFHEPEGSSSAIEPLFRLLLDSNPEVRRQASEMLVVLGEEAAPGLCGMIGCGYVAVQGLKEVLVRIGPPAIPHLGQLLRNPGPEARTLGVTVLGEIGDAAAVPFLLTALRDSELQVRKRAVEGLGNIGDSGAIFHLIEALADASADVCAAAAEALGKLKDARAVPVLIEKLAYWDWEVRWCAARALGSIGDSRGVLPLVEALRTGRLNEIDAALALGGIAEADPVLELRAALPLLRRSLPPWSPADLGTQRAYRMALRQIEAATAAFKDLPLPAAAPAPVVESLPVPAASAPPPADALPIPAEGGVVAMGVMPVEQRGSLQRRWRNLWRRESKP